MAERESEAIDMSALEDIIEGESSHIEFKAWTKIPDNKRKSNVVNLSA